MVANGPLQCSSGISVSRVEANRVSPYTLHVRADEGEVGCGVCQAYVSQLGHSIQPHNLPEDVNRKSPTYLPSIFEPVSMLVLARKSKSTC